MPAIRCHYEDCLHLEDGFCSAGAVELDPEVGCLTYEPEIVTEGDDWEEDGLGDLWHDDDEPLYEDADDAEWYVDDQPD